MLFCERHNFNSKFYFQYFYRRSYLEGLQVIRLLIGYIVCFHRCYSNNKGKKGKIRQNPFSSSGEKRKKMSV